MNVMVLDTTGADNPYKITLRPGKEIYLAPVDVYIRFQIKITPFCGTEDEAVALIMEVKLLTATPGADGLPAADLVRLAVSDQMVALVKETIAAISSPLQNSKSML